MAWTLQERINVEKPGVALTAAVTYVEKVSEQIKKTAQAIFDQTLTVSDAVFTNKGVTQAQLEEWALRAIEGQMDKKILALVKDSSRMPADPAAVTDTELRVAVKEAIWPLARLIGKGSF
jgi:hypothetical protein